LQSGKSADLAGAFGGAGTQSTFGPRGVASILSKMTTTLAVLFMVTSLSLWIIAANKSESKTVLSKDDVKQGQKAEDKKSEKKPATDTKKDNVDKTGQSKPTKADQKKETPKEAGGQEKKKEENTTKNS